MANNLAETWYVTYLPSVFSFPCPELWMSLHCLWARCSLLFFCILFLLPFKILSLSFNRLTEICLSYIWVWVSSMCKLSGLITFGIFWVLLSWNILFYVALYLSSLVLELPLHVCVHVLAVSRVSVYVWSSLLLYSSC